MKGWYCPIQSSNPRYAASLPIPASSGTMARERLLAAVGTEAVTGVDMKFYDSTYKRDAGLPFLESIASGSADPYIAGIAEKTLEGVRKGSYTFPYHGILETFQEMEK